MGIHAQPTCVINYDGATGWMVGSPNRGLNAMFTMMNAERLFVGIQGLGIGEAAYQKARAYARQRVQGRSSDGTRGPVAIIEHPDVRKMLMTVRCLTEGGRALAVWTAMQMDCASRHPDEKKRAEAAAMVALLTPVVKAALTDFGFEIGRDVATGLWRPRLYSRMGRRAVCTRRPNYTNLRRHERGAGSGFGRAQDPSRQWSRDAPLP